MYLHLFLFVYDRLFCKKEDKSGFSVYLILFVAGFLASGSMAWLFFNQYLKFFLFWYHILSKLQRELHSY